MLLTSNVISDLSHILLLLPPVRSPLELHGLCALLGHTYRPLYKRPKNTVLHFFSDIVQKDITELKIDLFDKILKSLSQQCSSITKCE